jgi:hypothetical protein
MRNPVILALFLAVPVRSLGSVQDSSFTSLTQSQRRTAKLDSLSARLQQPEQKRRHLSAFDDNRSSLIGESIGRPSRDPQTGTEEQNVQQPVQTPQNEKLPTTAGPPRRAILPFIVSLSPIASSPTYQQQIQVRNTVEEIVEQHFKSKYSATVSDVRNTTIAYAPTTAVVTYVGLTQIVDSAHNTDTKTAVIEMKGMVYFADGSVNVPSEQDVAQMVTDEFLTQETLVPALSGLFPTLQTTRAESALEQDEVVTVTTDAPTVATASPTTAPVTITLPPSTAAPISPPPTTLAPTSLPAPTVTPTTSVTAIPVPIPTDSPTIWSTPEQSMTPAPTTESPTASPTVAVTTAETVTPAPSIDVVTAATETPSATPTVYATVWEATWWPDTELPDTQAPTVAAAAAPPAPSLTIPADTSSPVLGTASIVGSDNESSNNDGSVNVNVLIGCAVGGFIAIVLAAIALVQIQKWRKDDKNAEDRKSLALFAKSDEDYDSNDDEELVEMDVARLVNFDDEDVLSGFVQEGDSRESSSWASDPMKSKQREAPDKSGETVDAADIEEDLESGRTDQPAVPRSPSEVSGSRRRKTHEAETAKNVAAGASVMSYWSSFFGKPNTSSKKAEVDLLSDWDPPALRSASVGSTDGGADTDGTLSEFGDGVSVEPDAVSKSMESFQQHALKDQYIVKKDMLESSATTMAPLKKTNACSQENLGIEASLSQDIEASRSEVEEDRQAKSVMMPNPYFRRPFNGIQPTVDRSGTCALKPTDTSAATLAQREADEEIDADDVDASQVKTSSRMVPRISSPKSWWRKSSSKGTKIVGESIDDKDEDSTFGPSASNGWDPNDTELGSMGTSPKEEELFTPVVDSRTGQALTADSRRVQSSPPTANERTSDETFGYTSFKMDSGSVSSEEGHSLKLDSAFSF